VSARNSPAIFEARAEPPPCALSCGSFLAYFALRRHKLRIKMNRNDNAFDSVIIGGGPAGLTALLYLARCGRRAICLDARSGRTLIIAKSMNHTGFDSGISGLSLIERTEHQACAAGGEILRAFVNRVERSTEADAAGTNGGTDSPAASFPFKLWARPIIFSLPESPAISLSPFGEQADEETPLLGMQRAKWTGGAQAQAETRGRLEDDEAVGLALDDDDNYEGNGGHAEPPSPHAFFCAASATACLPERPLAPTEPSIVLQARSIILATGVKDREPVLPGLPANPIRSGIVAVSPLAQALEHKGKRVGVIGSGPQALAVIAILRMFTDQLTLLTNGQETAPTVSDASPSHSVDAFMRQTGVNAITKRIVFVQTAEGLSAAAKKRTQGANEQQHQGQQSSEHEQQHHHHRDTNPVSHFRHYLDVEPGIPSSESGSDLDLETPHVSLPMRGAPSGHSPSFQQRSAEHHQHQEHQEPTFTICFEGGEKVELDALFSGLGTHPCSLLAASLGADLSAEGRVLRSDLDGSTSVSGLFAAGDVTPGIAQMGVACGQGAIAACGVHAYLTAVELGMEQGGSSSDENRGFAIGDGHSRQLRSAIAEFSW
jgi:thioredoxin reductase